MILFAVAAVPVISAILILTRDPGAQTTTNRLSQLFIGIFWFVPYLVLYGLIAPLLPVSFDFGSQIWTIAVRGLILPIFAVVVALFTMPPIRSVGGDARWFLASFWSLVGGQNVVVSLQSADAVSLFIWPAMLVVFVPIMVAFGRLVYRHPGQAYLTGPLWLILAFLASTVPVLWYFNAWAWSSVDLGLWVLIALVFDRIKIDAVADRVGRLPPIRIRLPRWKFGRRAAR